MSATDSEGNFLGTEEQPSSGKRRYRLRDLHEISTVSLRERLDSIDNPLAWRIARELFSNTLASQLVELDETRPPRQRNHLIEFIGNNPRRFQRTLNRLSRRRLSWLLLDEAPPLDPVLEIISRLLPGSRLKLNSIRSDDISLHLLENLELLTEPQSRMNWSLLYRLRLIGGSLLALLSLLLGTLCCVLATAYAALSFLIVPGVLGIVIGLILPLQLWTWYSDSREERRLALFISFTDEFSRTDNELDSETLAWRELNTIGGIQRPSDVNELRAALDRLPWREFAELGFGELAARRHRLPTRRLRRLAAAILRRYSAEWQQQGLGNRPYQLARNLRQLCGSTAGLERLKTDIGLLRTLNLRMLFSLKSGQLAARLKRSNSLLNFVLSNLTPNDVDSFAAALLDYPDVFFRNSTPFQCAVRRWLDRYSSRNTSVLVLLSVLLIAGLNKAEDAMFYILLAGIFLLVRFDNTSQRRHFMGDLAMYLAMLEEYDLLPELQGAAASYSTMQPVDEANVATTELPDDAEPPRETRSGAVGRVRLDDE